MWDSFIDAECSSSAVFISLWIFLGGERGIAIDRGLPLDYSLFSFDDYYLYWDNRVWPEEDFYKVDSPLFLRWVLYPIPNELNYYCDLGSVERLESFK